MGWLERLVERQMLKAAAEGKLTGLKGEGKPLPERPDLEAVKPDIAAGFRIMSEAGVLPEEIVWKQRASEQRALLQTLSDPVEQSKAMAKLAEMEMRQAMASEAMRRFLKD